MQQLQLSESLPLFQSTHNINSSPVLDRGISIINNMIELDYIKFGSKGLEFTNAGIDYMNRKFNEFQNDFSNKDIDFGDFNGIVNTKSSKVGHNMLKDFKSSTLLISTECNEVDYNDIVLNKKYDSLEPLI